MICLKYMSNLSIYCGSSTRKTKQNKKQKKDGTHTRHKKSYTKIKVKWTIKNKMNNIDNTKIIIIK